MNLDMSLGDAISIVSAHGWYSERTESFKTELRSLARLKHCVAGETLYHHGDEPNGIFGLAAGGLDVCIPRDDGIDVTVHRADLGYWIGDLAMFGGETRLVTVVTPVASTFVHLPQVELYRLVERAPQYFPEFYALTYQNMALALRLVANLTIASSEVRVAVRLLISQETHNRTLNVSQGKFAEFVGLSVPTLQRILRRFQDEGIVRVRYGHIEIVDKERLLAICERPPNRG